MKKNITDTITYIGVNDCELDLFEGQFTVPEGMAYNSYLITDEKTAVMDTMDRNKTSEWLEKLSDALNGRTPDYLIVQHMEPDHSASIAAFLSRYPEACVVGNSRTFKMIKGFFPDLEIKNTREVKNGEKLSLGEHTLTFLLTPMVHWPEVMMTYDEKDRLIFCADAYGKFGAVKENDPDYSDLEESWACEARRYYFGIVGKYGAQVQNVFKAVADLEITKLLPLHGPVLEQNLEYFLGLYDTWSSYRPETEGICICYTSVYGNTENAVKLLCEKLGERGEHIIAVNDLARCDMAEAIEDAFRYDRLILATTTYNGEIFPFMRHFIDGLKERFYQNRKVGLIENGSWGPAALRIMKKDFEEMKNIELSEKTVSIMSSLSEKSRAEIEALADDMA